MGLWMLFLKGSVVCLDGLALSKRPNALDEGVLARQPQLRNNAVSASEGEFWVVSSSESSKIYGSFRKLGVPYFGVLIIRILLFRVPY